ncbi:DUF11 domain-containing protein [Herpetosiphon geysericola]|uniref:DUF11 domain-containing protein n=1 Tax=Herpetosiphon geysericola TaxID=70996 RepID=UPI0006C91D8B|nr:DUF11 domain-containing protein [Herpetosiphon geysericola]
MGRQPFRYQRLALLSLVALLGCITPTKAVEIPPAGASVYLQTNGPTNTLNNGDWYTNNTAGAGNGSHYFTVEIPCSVNTTTTTGGWPTNQPVHIDIFSPEMNSTTTVSDEQRGGSYDNTQFEFYAAGTVIGPGPATPAPGSAGSLHQQTFVPAATAPTWVRLYTIAAPVTCGNYVLRSSTFGNDENGWRLRVGRDNDNDPNTAPPANTDNFDGVAGTGDEITIGMRQASFQHDAGNPDTVATCLTLYEYVAPGQPSVNFNNFDIDNLRRVRYYAPGDPSYTPMGNTGGIVGTLSNDQIWNGAGATLATRVGDTINNPAAGWWRIVTCTSDHNQFIQEGQTGVQAYYQQPPTPIMALSKTDGVTLVTPGDTLNYTITFTNTSNTTATPGAATNVTLTDNLPPSTTFVSCAINAPFTGTCSHSGGIVSFNINQIVRPGEIGQLNVQVTVNNPITVVPVVNNVTLNFNDSLNNIFQPLTASDNDLVNPTAVNVVGLSALARTNAIQVRWSTSSEVDSQGFHIYRSISDDESTAVQVTESLIPALGAHSSYQWLDTNVMPNVRYYYWLAEVDTNNTLTMVGQTEAQIERYTIFTPFVLR